MLASPRPALVLALVGLLAVGGLVMLPPRVAAAASFEGPIPLPALLGYYSGGPPAGALSCAGPQLAYGGQAVSGFGWQPVSPAPAWPSYAPDAAFPGATNMISGSVVAVIPFGTDYVYAWQSSNGMLTLGMQSATGVFEGLAPVTPQAQGLAFDLATDGTFVYLAWVDSGSLNGTLRVARVTPSTGALGATAVIDADPNHAKVDVDLVAAGPSLDVVWRRSNINGSEAYFARVTLGGPSPVPVAVTPSLLATRQFAPVVASFANGTAIVAMTDDDGGSIPRIPAAFITSPYTAFGPPFDLGARAGGSVPDAPQIFVDDSGTLHMAFLDGSLATHTLDLRVMYAASPNGGATFSSALRVDNDTGPSSKNLARIIPGTNGDLFIGWSGGSYSFPWIARGVVPGVHASFTTTPRVLFANTAVTFDGSASAAGGTVTAYTWSFGDGGSATGAQVAHMFTHAGTYVVTLTVTDVSGNFRTTCLPVIVAAAVTYTTIRHAAGFTIDVPTDWQVQENVTLAGLTYQLLATGPSANFFTTNVLVSTEANASVRQDSAYLLATVQQTLASIQQSNPTAYLEEPAQLRTLGGYPAVSFVIRYGSSGIVQKGAFIASTALQRDWVILLSCDSTLYPWMNVTFEHMLASFTITLTPPLLSSGLLAAALVGGALGAAGALVAYVVLRRRKRSTTEPTSPGAATPSAASTVCASCGASLEAGAPFCGKCGAPSPSPPPGPSGGSPPPPVGPAGGPPGGQSGP